jgi:RNA 2',3'-cyclic 3'-phosphodiesterase
VLRTFIAIDLPPGVQGALGKLEKELQEARTPITWVRPERIHLTLKFLGDVAPERIPEIQGRLEEVAGNASSFRLEPAGCGAFPTLKQMRVIWVGLQGEGSGLNTLQQAVEEAMVQLGFKREERPFKPHLTIGRVKGRQHLRVLQELLIERQSFKAEAFDVAELVLYKSELRPEGARYTPLFRKRLTGGASATTIQG